MLALRLPPNIEKRLEKLARNEGKTKNEFALEVLMNHMEDLEDLAIAEQRIAEGGPTISLDEVMKKYAEIDKDVTGVDDQD
ncbi:type II toxin-antitoxin system RelB family antitoxin [Phyllobacterium leguminum]|uniref:RHH-type rel operon transcriptional repressor/antitoxin RelB n=1 Tax=Phyllobacterium leguminum TaxID=314237 RepID=A0A318T7P8_9HYPH|nr:DUF6290 family protein [Phyllobacterium leguminum]PYE86564.1 RHH-type rel operon transcriptional repressor/antitoxin RelB [Phyllobacterium leguminum]